MYVVRVYTGDDGESHFEDVAIGLEDRGLGGRISRLIRGSGVMFREVDATYDLDFHNAPRRQFVVNLTGYHGWGWHYTTPRPGRDSARRGHVGPRSQECGGGWQVENVSLYTRRRRR